MIKLYSLAYFLWIIFSLVASSSAENDNGDLSQTLPVLKANCPEFSGPVLRSYWNSNKNPEIATLTVQNERDSLANEDKTITTTSNSKGNKIREFISLLSMENNERPVRNVFRFGVRNPIAEGYKRGPGFRSWGGKRGLLSKVDESMKKSRFTSWGGKKGAKLITPTYTLENNDKIFECSELKKKVVENNRENEEGKTFLQENSNPWTYDNIHHWSHVMGLTPGALTSSWGNKRATPSLRRPYQLYDFQLFPKEYIFGRLSNWNEKRKFSSWGGKRSENDRSEINKPILRNFNSWGGKREANKIQNYMLWNENYREVSDEEGYNGKFPIPTTPYVLQANYKIKKEKK